MNVNKYIHQPMPHLNGPILGGNPPTPGNVSSVIPTAGSVLKGTNVGGNVITRTASSIIARFTGRI